MGTIGVMRCIGEDGAPAVYGFSTSDSPPAQFWHGLAGGPSRHAVLAYGLMPQQGINAGLNERGLLIVSSHFDFADPSDHPVIRGVGDCWLGDLRGLIQAEALAVCIDAWDALEAMRRGIAEGGRRSAEATSSPTEAARSSYSSIAAGAPPGGTRRLRDGR